MNKYLIAYIFSLIGLLAFAQEELTPQQQVNSIKRNRTEYIFGESTGSTEEEAYELANEKFMSNLQNYIESMPELKDAFAVMMPTINKSIKKISFDRRVNVKVVCLYINKADIKPLYKNVEGKQEINLTNDKVSKNQADKPGNVSSDHKDPVNPKLINSKPGATKEKQEEKIELNQSNRMNQMNQADMSAKSVEILSVLGGMSDYANQKQWLEDRKQKEHDIMFG